MTDKVLCSTKWLQLRKGRAGYIYSSGNDVVYVLGFRKGPENGKDILGRFEQCPAHGDTEMKLTSITGQILQGQATPLGIAIEEMHEEGGYIVEPDEFVSLGKVNLTKSTSIVGHMFAVDLTGKEKVKATTDGSVLEQGTYCDWVTFKEAMNCKCPVMGCMLLRLAVLKG